MQEISIATAPLKYNQTGLVYSINMTHNGDIDEGLYSRQLYVLGHDAMRRMAISDVLISGLGGLGVEVAKNVILGGVKSVTLHDQTTCKFKDLTSQYFLTKFDIGKNRAEASLPKLAELNRYVCVKAYTDKLTAEYLMKFKVVILTNSTLQEQLQVAEIVRYNGTSLIVADTRGLFGQIFCDFGDEFTVTDTTGEDSVSLMIATISRDKEGVVICFDEQPTGLEDGDYVSFSGIVGMTELNECGTKKIRVLGPYSFAIGDTSGYSEYKSGGVVTQVKMPRVLKFKPLMESIKNPDFIITDFVKCERPPQIHLAFTILHEFIEQRGEAPKPWNQEDADAFVSLAKTKGLTDGNDEKFNNELLETFAKLSSGDVPPINAIIGGIVAQEVMKACSGKFSPIYQWLYFDALECLPVDLSGITEESCKAVGSRYDGQIAVFGNTFQQRLGKLNYFVVGAGAIGCELLKNFAMMGIGAYEGGKVTVTDMDLIEKSNLNRQFLFRLSDVQRPKSVCAANAVRRMNPAINVVAHENRVGQDTERVYNDSFFESLDGVANALDNVEDRLYMDKLCVYYRKSLLECGTLGTKGNTQVVVPFLTESYSSSVDPPEKRIAICTLKNFPNAIEHTLQWARDDFEGLFYQCIKSAAQYFTDPTFLEQTLQLTDQQPVEILECVKKVIVDERPSSFEDCVAWARCYWQEQYNNSIRQILSNFPPDQLTSDEQPFWSGPKRCPTPLDFSANNQLHIDYIFAASNLKAEVYGIPQNRDRQVIIDIVKNVVVSEFTPISGVNMLLENSHTQLTPAGNNELRSLLSELPRINQVRGLQLNPLSFEKDDDANLHMDFIVAASNLRAANYGIPPADRHKSKLIAGRIIPAIATTTSVIAGLACLELYKLAQNNKPLNSFKNGYINLALPLFTFSEPIAALKMKYHGGEWTLWDRFDIHGELTLCELLDLFKQRYGLEITMLSCGMCMLYSFFMAKEKCLKRMHMPISEIVMMVMKRMIEPHEKALVLDACCNDCEGYDVEVPYIRYVLPTDMMII